MGATPKRPTLEGVLEQQQLNLQEMIREAENAEWHHCAEGTVERMHYDRLVRAEEIVDAQRTRLPQRVQPAAPREDRLVQ